MRTACVAVVKNEERRIEEWIGYQFAAGFDKVLLLDHLSTDTTKSRALALANSYDVEVLDWPVTAEAYQTLAYEFAVAHLSGFDWIGFFDTDKFLVMAPGLELKTCLAARHAAAAVVVSWAMFGSSGHRAAPAGLVVQNFLHRSLPSFGPNAHVKSIIRPEAMISCINAHVFRVDGATTTLAGEALSWLHPGVRNGPPDYRLGKLHHYFTRSLQEWVEKRRRGHVAAPRRKLSEFLAYDRNEVFDDSAARVLRTA